MVLDIASEFLNMMRNENESNRNQTQQVNQHRTPKMDLEMNKKEITTPASRPQIASNSRSLQFFEHLLLLKIN